MFCPGPKWLSYQECSFIQWSMWGAHYYSLVQSINGERVMESGSKLVPISVLSNPVSLLLVLFRTYCHVAVLLLLVPELIARQHLFGGMC